MTSTTPKIAYRFNDGVYINLTNRCPNLCVFCIKTKWQMDFHGNNLNLAGNEPTAQEVLRALEDELVKAPFKEVVFCGYGEPTMRLDVLLYVAQTLKGWQAQAKFPPFKIRLNTNGLGNRINHKPIVGELRRVVDIVNVSVNAQDETTWRALMRPEPEYRDAAKAQEVFETLDEEMLSNLPAVLPKDGPVHFLVGPENIAKELKDTSVVMMRFDIGDGMQGTVGVVGPTRMDYAKITAKLGYFAENLGKMFQKNGGESMPPALTEGSGDNTK